MPSAAATPVVATIAARRSTVSGTTLDCSTDGDRAGKPSLVLDAVEEFRQPVVDRTVFGLLNRGSKLEVADGRLSDATRRLLAERVLQRLAGLEPYAGKRYSLGAIVQAQARRLAGFLRGDGKPYEAYVSRW